MEKEISAAERDAHAIESFYPYPPIWYFINLYQMDMNIDR